MTECEAIKIIEDYVEECNYTWTVEQLFAEYVKRRNKSYVSYTADDVIDHCWSAFKFLEVKALNEVLEYRKLGTVGKCREAVEKTNEKKPILINYKKYIDKIENAEFLKDSYLCPNCKTVLRSGKYCNRCGQKIDWIGQKLESKK